MKNKIFGVIKRNKVDLVSLLLAIIISAIIGFGVFSCFLYYCFIAGFLKLQSKIFCDVFRIKIIRVQPAIPDLVEDEKELELIK